MKYISDRSSEDIKCVGGLCLIALLCQARTDFNDVELFRRDYFFAEALGIDQVPSKATFRQHLNACNNSVRSAIKIANLASLKNVTFSREKIGEDFFIPVDTWWTNLPHCAEDVIASYHAHGTSEQFHSEFKTDMNVERLPSGNFSTNATILLLSGIAFNILRLIGQTMLTHPEAMPARLKIKRRRLGSVIKDLIYIACKIVRHAGSVKLRFGIGCLWFKSFAEIYHDFCRKPELV